MLFFAWAITLVRAAIYEFENQSVIALTAHHAISDGRSLTCVLRDLLNAMNGKYASPYIMPPSIDSYTDLPENVPPHYSQKASILNKCWLL
jgi:hypothetical protein